jgi:hypothetical protein
MVNPGVCLAISQFGHLSTLATHVLPAVRSHLAHQRRIGPSCTAAARVRPSGAKARARTSLGP